MNGINNWACHEGLNKTTALNSVHLQVGYKPILRNNALFGSTKIIVVILIMK